MALSTHAEELYSYWTMLSPYAPAEYGADEFLDICGREAIVVLSNDDAANGRAMDPLVVVGGFVAFDALGRLRARNLAPKHIIIRQVDRSEEEQRAMIAREFGTLARQLRPRANAHAVTALEKRLSSACRKAVFEKEMPEPDDVGELAGSAPNPLRHQIKKPQKTIFERIMHGA